MSKRANLIVRLSVELAVFVLKAVVVTLFLALVPPLFVLETLMELLRKITRKEAREIQ